MVIAMLGLPVGRWLAVMVVVAAAALAELTASLDVLGMFGVGLVDVAGISGRELDPFLGCDCWLHVLGAFLGEAPLSLYRGSVAGAA